MLCSCCRSSVLRQVRVAAFHLFASAYVEIPNRGLTTSLSQLGCSSVWQCARQCVAVCTVVCAQCARQCAAVRLVVFRSAAECVWQCGSVRQCVAMRVAVCGSARGSVRECAAVCGNVWQCAITGKMGWMPRRTDLASEMVQEGAGCCVVHSLYL
jgi:hypothetical protein